MIRRSTSLHTLCCLILGLVCVTSSIASQEAARFELPKDGGIVVGETEFRFEVSSPDVRRIDVYVQGRLIGTAEAGTWSFLWKAPPGLVSERIVATVFGDQGLMEKLEISTSDAVFGEVLDVVAVELYPIVLDRKGRYVPNLGQEEFAVYDRNQRVPIETFSTSPAALTVALVVDVSQSMKGDLYAVQTAAIDFVDRLEAQDRVAVYSFNHSLTREQELTTDHVRAQSRIRSLTATGGTALYDAVVQVSTELRGVAGRKVVVLFSDGRDERSVSTLERSVRSVHESEAITYSIGSGSEEEDLAARPDLRELAEQTGGEGFFIQNTRSLSEVFGQISRDIRAQYAITFTPRSLEAGEHRVEVRARNPDYRVRSRTRYILERQAPE